MTAPSMSHHRTGSAVEGIPTDEWGSTAAPLPGPTRLPLGRGNQAQIADTVRKVTGGKALEVAAFNSYAE